MNFIFFNFPSSLNVYANLDMRDDIIVVNFLDDYSSAVATGSSIAVTRMVAALVA